jgi:hypothetical protein
MATAWPNVAAVQQYLRVEAGDSGEDALIGTDLAAAVQWVSNRVDPQYVPGSATYAGTLPDPLYTSALMWAGRLYRRRDSVDGTIGWGDMGVIRVGPKDPDPETLMAPYLVIVI